VYQRRREKERREGEEREERKKEGMGRCSTLFSLSPELLSFSHLHLIRTNTKERTGPF
jgi:hypothetical protein